MCPSNQTRSFTRVADGSLPPATVLIVPLGCVVPPLNVNLNTVLSCYVIWLVWRPILSLFGHLLLGSIPDPLSTLFTYAYPVIFFMFWQQFVDEVILLHVPDGHHVCEVLLAPLAGLRPSTVCTGAVVVGPCLRSSSAAQV